MIPFDFDYFKPESMDEAFKYYQDLLINNKKTSLLWGRNRNYQYGQGRGDRI